MWNGGNITYQFDTKTRLLQPAYRRVSTGTNPLDHDPCLLHPLSHGFLGRRRSGRLGRKGGSLSGTSEAAGARRRPGNNLSSQRRDRNDRVIETGLNMNDPLRCLSFRFL